MKPVDRKKAQRSSLFLAQHRQRDRWLNLAKKHFDRAQACQREALQEARRCGEFLCEAKSHWKSRSRNRWLKLLKHIFKRGFRTAQTYMQIYREWGRIEPLLVRYPNLSIDKALRSLRHNGSVEEKQDSWDYKSFCESVQWSQLLKETWYSWDARIKDQIREQPFDFREMMEELRVTTVLKHCPRSEWQKLLPGKNLKTLRKKQRQEGIRATRARILAFQSGVTSTLSWEEKLGAGLV